jgi:SRSO17 transposase
MTPEEMDEVRPRLEAFAAEMLGSLPRRDQRGKGELYVRGLMLDGKRKSMQPMAERLGVDHQRLQQFVSSSTWDWTEVRERLARWAAAHISLSRGVRDRRRGLPQGRLRLSGRGTDVLRRTGGPYFNKCSAEGCWWEPEI